ncbi:MAG: PEP-CTERM sorting domain-containing protein [Phycisphaerales bacterium]|nr:PEP-CTERM sorting domain-containing protein [Phycisphaerales bacterium]
MAAVATVGLGLLAGEAASAAVIFSNITPGITDINTLQSIKTGAVYIGMFGDTGSQYTTTMGEWAYGIYLTPTTAGTLTEAQIPLDIGGTTGNLRMELYQVPAMPAANSNPSAATIASYSLLDTATVTGLSGGKHWTTFDFTQDGVAYMDTNSTYLLFVTVTSVGSNRWATQQHYWLGRNLASPTSRLLRTYDAHSYSALVPEHNMGSPLVIDSRQPGIQLSSVVPEPASLAGVSLLLGALALRPRREVMVGEGD